MATGNQAGPMIKLLPRTFSYALSQALSQALS
ncbi:MAG: hypothetical protein ACI883_001703, partial [Candidatus Azotimanducaceae bacterium]